MKHYKKNLYRLPLSLSITELDIEKDLNTIINIENACFDEKMQDEAKDFKEFFEDENAFGLILYQDSEAIGYFSGTHAYDIEDEESDIDVPELIENAEYTCFIDSIAILPEYRSVITLDFLFHEIAHLCIKYDYLYLIGYARVRGGYSRTLRQRYGAKIIKRYENWQGFGEKFEFIYFGNDFPRLPKIIYNFYNLLRKIRTKLIKLNLIKSKHIKN